MPRRRMVVIAGPPGSGKTRYFPVTAFGVDSFNIDDRCAQILGSYRAIPRDVRQVDTRRSFLQGSPDPTRSRPWRARPSVWATARSMVSEVASRVAIMAGRRVGGWRSLG